VTRQVDENEDMKKRRRRPRYPIFDDVQYLEKKEEQMEERRRRWKTKSAIRHSIPHDVIATDRIFNSQAFREIVNYLSEEVHVHIF